MSAPDSTAIRLQQRLHVLLTGLWLRRTLIIIPIMIMPLVGAVVGLSSDKTYLTHTSILIQEPALFNPFLEDLAISTNLEDRMPGLNALLHSRHVLSKVGEELNWLNATSTNEQIDYFVYWLGSKLSLRLYGTDLVRIELLHSDPAEMAEILETVTTYLIEQIVAPEQSSLTGSETFLRAQLDQRHTALLKAEQALAEFKSANSEKLPELHAANITETNRLSRAIVETETELAGTRAQLSAARQKLTQTNPLLGQLEKIIIDVRGQLAGAQASYTDSHSTVRGLKRRLEHLHNERRRILEEAKPLTTEDLDRLWNMLSSPEISEAPGQQSLLYLQLESVHIASQREQSLVHELNTLRQSLEEVSARVRSFGDIEMKLNGLERELNIQNQVYNDLFKRWELAQVTRALGDYESGERIKIIDRPYEPSSPINPGLILYILAGLAAGVALGVGLAVILEITDTHVKRQDDVTQLTGLPVLVRLPPLS